ncbi:MAG: hypothetical protein DHS20C03_35040 [Minwuia thermotolerans]|nr:MAG: hypothetical protein DHS20C03_35040 [Minwuia thermotolerans]
MDWIAEQLDALIVYIGDETRQGALALIGSTVAAIIAGGWFLLKARKPPKAEENSKNKGKTEKETTNSAGTISLTIEEYDRRLREREETLRTQIESAVGIEKNSLEAQRKELNDRLSNIESAYGEAKSKIRQLENALAMAGDDVSEQRLSAAMEALNKGDTSVAAKLFDEIEEAQEHALLRAAQAAYGKGLIAEEKIDWQEAARNFYKSMSLYKSEDTLYKAGLYLWRSGYHIPAAQANHELLELIENRCGRKSADYAGAINNLAAQLYELGHTEEAIEKFEKSLAIEREIGRGDTINYACTTANLANAYIWDRKIVTAERLHREAISIAENAVGKNDERYISILNGLAETLRLRKKYDESEELFKRAIELDLETYGNDHPFHARNLHFYSKLLRDMNRFDDAKKSLYKAIPIARRKMGEHHPNTIAIADHFAWLIRHSESNDKDQIMLQDLECVYGEFIGTQDKDETIHPSVTGNSYSFNY